eukprot:Lankesteria_metandrocarpae@DN7555_c0_g1_i1.p1
MSGRSLIVTAGASFSRNSTRGSSSCSVDSSGAAAGDSQTEDTSNCSDDDDEDDSAEELSDSGDDANLQRYLDSRQRRAVAVTEELNQQKQRSIHDSETDHECDTDHNTGQKRPVRITVYPLGVMRRNHRVATYTIIAILFGFCLLSILWDAALFIFTTVD